MTRPISEIAQSWRRWRSAFGTITLFLLSMGQALGANWTTQNAGSLPGNLLDIRFWDPLKGVAVGSDGIFATLDGGNTWTRKIESYTVSIAFSNNQTAWAVGNSGMFKSIDSGSEWLPIQMEAGISFSSIHFFDEKYGWATGSENTLLRTVDGGVTWSSYHSTAYYPIATHFISPQVGWILGDLGAPFEKTTDSGATWSGQALGDSNVVLMEGLSIAFVNPSTGFFSGDGYGKSGGGMINVLFKTTDSGQSWVRLPCASRLKSLQFLDASRGSAIIHGADGRDSLAFTTDGGKTWIPQAQIESAWNRLWSYDANLRFAVGDYGAMVKSTDGGAHWKPTQKGITSNLLTVWAIDSLRAFVGGWYGELGSTIDGGETWKKAKVNGDASIISIGFLDDKTGWAVGGGGSISKTSDGGLTWQAQSSGTTDPLEYVTAISANVVYALTKNNPAKVFKTTNGGGDWTLAATLPAYIQSISFSDSVRGWAVAFSGEVFHTRDGGKSWQPQASGVTAALLSVQFLDSLVGWASGDNQLLSTTDGGATWSGQSLPYTNVHVYFSDKNHGWLWNYNGLLYRTLDGGGTWRKIEESPISIMSTHFADSLHGWRVGPDGFIQKTWNGGGEGIPITFISSLRRASRSGMPFHFTDNRLSYTLQIAGRVDATAYDTEGKLIKRVLSARQGAGQHFLDLSSLTATSGFYILDFQSPSGKRSIPFRLGR